MLALPGQSFVKAWALNLGDFFQIAVIPSRARDRTRFEDISGHSEPDWRFLRSSE
jgi:hypothetical protein